MPTSCAYRPRPCAAACEMNLASAAMVEPVAFAINAVGLGRSDTANSAFVIGAWRRPVP